MSNTSVIGSGTTIAVEPVAGGGNHTVLGEVTSITPPASSTDSVEATHMGSGGVREFIPGLQDPGEVEVTFHFLPGNATDDLVAAWDAARELREVVITYNNGEDLTFQAFITNYAPEVPFDDRQVATLTMKVTGPAARSS